MSYEFDVARFLSSLKSTHGIFYVFDTETTGLDPADADIVEFSALKVRKTGEKMEIIDELDIYINPGYDMPEAASAINGITTAFLLEHGIAPEKAVSVIKDFLGDNPIVVGYNSVSFDQGFVDQMFRREGLRFVPDCHLDVLKMAREKHPKGRHRLIDMAEIAGCKNGKVFHTSIDDARATLSVMEYFLKMY